MTTSYGHFCLAARTLEAVGDRWSLLIIRDLLVGPRRFTDLQRLLTTVTAKSLAIRLRQLEADGVVRRDQQPGRREVWYELTEKGRDLAPVLEALISWGLKHERRPLAADEAAHPEHMLAGVAVALNEGPPQPWRRRAWSFEFGDEEVSLTLVFDGKRWSLVRDQRPADVVVSTTPRAWAEFLTTPPAKRRLPSKEIDLDGAVERVGELVEAFGGTPTGR
jgi:DNA-binding HxlR family transcriptional regulator